jgi:hypothetical protein
MAKKTDAASWISWVVVAAFLGACSDDGAGPQDAGTSPDAPVADWRAPDGSAPDGTWPDAWPGDAGHDGAPTDAGPDQTITPLPRGLKWVRANPMFVSGLTVSMGAPSAAAVTDYFQGFKANAVHLWQTGLPDEINGWRTHNGPTTPFVSWVDQNGKSSANGQLIGGLPADTPGRIGFQISDEPQDMTHFNAMVAAAVQVRQADPNALIIFNYTYNLPQLDQALVQAGSSEMDVYSYDVYTRSNSAYEHLARYREAGLTYKRPYWRYIRGYLPSTSSDDALSESDARWDAFSGLVYGYTGHSWFLYQVAANHNLQPAFFATAGSFTAPKTPEFAMVAKINTELRNLGRAITQLTSTEVCYTPSIALLQPAKTKPFTPGAGGDPYLEKITVGVGTFVDYLVGFFVDDAGERYVMLQNVKHTHGSFPVDVGVGPATFAVDFDFSGAVGAAVDKTKLLSLDKTTGQVVSLSLTSLGGDKARLTVTLEAGDPVLFKYATGAPFALGP